MNVGYARASIEERGRAPQVAALRRAGCHQIFREKTSGACHQRPKLQRLLDQLKKGDTVVVWKLDRLACSTRDLVEIAETIRKVGASFRSLSEPWADTTAAHTRKIVMTVLAGIADFERGMIRERSRTGRSVAIRRGVRFGRPPKLTPEQLQQALHLLKQGSPASDVAKVFSVHVSTIYRAVTAVARP